MEADAFQEEGSFVVTFLFALFTAISEIGILKLCSILARYSIASKILVLCSVLLTLSFFVTEPFGDIIAIPITLAILYKFNSNRRIFLFFGISLFLNWFYLYIFLTPLFLYILLLVSDVLH